MVALAAIAAVLAVGLLATGQLEFARSLMGRSLPKPPSGPSDDEIYTGSILYVPDEGKICRQLLFDNRTGRMRDNGLVDCEQAFFRGTSEMSKQWSTARALVISESFRQH
jgi:hypothetical protein